MSLKLSFPRRKPIGVRGDSRVPAPPHPKLNPLLISRASPEERLRAVLEQLPPITLRRIISQGLARQVSLSQEISRTSSGVLEEAPDTEEQQETLSPSEVSEEQREPLSTSEVSEEQREPLSTSEVSEETNETLSEGQVIETIYYPEKPSIPYRAIVQYTTRPAFTPEEIESLVLITTTEGELLFDPDDPDTLYQMLAMVLMLRDGKASLMERTPGIEIEETKDEKPRSFEEVLKYLLSLDWIIPEEAVHASPLMAHVRLERDVKRLELTEEPVVEEGNIVCRGPNCQSRKILRAWVQKRSADEGFTELLTCDTCGFHWRRGG